MAEWYDVPCIIVLVLQLNMTTISGCIVTTTVVTIAGLQPCLFLPVVNPAAIAERCWSWSFSQIVYVECTHKLNRPHIVCGLAATRPYWLEWTASDGRTDKKRTKIAKFSVKPQKLKIFGCILVDFAFIFEKSEIRANLTYALELSGWRFFLLTIWQGFEKYP